MILKESSEFMLKYAKTKAKLIEFGISEKDYPKFPANSNELSYPTIYILSKYSECIIENNIKEASMLYSKLVFVSEYYDAAVNSKDRESYDNDFLLSGAAAYFLSDDFGSSKVLISKIKNITGLSEISKLLVTFLNFLLLNKPILINTNDNSESKRYKSSVKFYFENGTSQKILIDILASYKELVYRGNVVIDVYYIDILYAITLKAIENSAWELLPPYSKVDVDNWKDYLKTARSVKILWAAQKLIGEYGLLQGNNAIVQLPTGVGKTKSIEIIIRASFLAKRANVVVIIAPLRALCNEISNDLSFHFGDSATINQYSDVLQEDFKFEIEDNKKHIVICTPEKFNYIMHHQNEILLSIGLFIFDEAHMFDDISRGATYELLVSEIKKLINNNIQIVLLSAVLSNANQICEWMFGDKGVVAHSKDIKTTFKSIGFSASDKNIYYYNNKKMDEFDFFIPKSIEIKPLKLFSKLEKYKKFPEDDPKDLSLYYGIKLCNNGGVAIYVNRTASVNTVMKKVLELKRREYDVDKIIENSDLKEIEKLHNLIKTHYGDKHEFSSSSLLGVFPHYSTLANGIKLAVEYAIKNNMIRFVICTSTLAQGVNIPIKYLFITSFISVRNSMQIRSFQNLIGRTARSGIYTEGSIIVTESKYFDKKNTYKDGGIYKWQECIEMFDATKSEECGSSILSVLKNLVVDYDTSFNGIQIAQYIIDNYNDKNCYTSLAEKISIKYLEKKAQSNNNNIFEQIMGIKLILESIENYLCYIFNITEIIDYAKRSEDICHQTLAYSMGTTEEQDLLIELFKVITEKILMNNGVEKLPFYSKAMVGIDTANIIIDWLDEKSSLLMDIGSGILLQEVIDLFFLVGNKIKYGLSKDEITLITRLWILGKTFFEIFSELKKKGLKYAINKVEDICSKTISYNMSFLVGNILDLVRVKFDDDILINKLTLLQKQLKYGVLTQTNISICETVFDDRVIATYLSNIIGESDIKEFDIADYIKHYKEPIRIFINDFPSYFTNKLNIIIKD